MEDTVELHVKADGGGIRAELALNWRTLAALLKAAAATVATMAALIEALARLGWLG
jgi:hypothetical protein